MHFQLTEDPINPQALCDAVRDHTAGGFASFEGWVRNHHQGRSVTKLCYEAYHRMATRHDLYETIDYNQVQAEIIRKLKAYEIREVGFDPWGAQQIIQNVMEQNPDVTCVEVPAGFAIRLPSDSVTGSGS